jgi:hypothetical protein
MTDPQSSVPCTGLYPSTEIVEPYPGVDVIDLVGVEDGAKLKKTTQDGARAAGEEARGVRATRLGECPGPVEGERERAAVRWNQRFRQLAYVRIIDATCTWIRRWV